MILPSLNRRDLVELPRQLREALTYPFVDNADEVLALAYAG